MVSNAEIRARARKQLGGSIFSSLWLLTLAVGLIYSVVVFTVQSLLDKIFENAGLVMNFVTGALAMGAIWVFLQIVRGKQTVDFGDMLVGFRRETVGRNLLLGFFITLFTTLWTLLLIVPGIIKAFSYSQAYFIALDHPEYTWRQCIDESRRMMDGKKMKYFCLSLSFIGWVFLGLLAFGIGVLWVIPYMYAAQANFYQSLLDEEAPAVTVETPAEEPTPEA